MRASALAVSVLLAAASLAALAPAVSAAMQACTSATDATCPGLFCKDEDGDRVFTPNECRHVPDRCEIHTDCCYFSIGDVWCPDEW